MITDTIKYIGVTDLEIDLFEGQYLVPDGITYNSYLINDEKTVVMDSVDAAFCEEWLENIKSALGGRTPDYLVVQHMEPDHSANIKNFLDEYPSAKIISSQKAFSMMKNFFGTDFPERQIIVSEGDKIKIGDGELTFITAPMVHWPEVIMTYYDKDKTLFSADGFGKFGKFSSLDNWADEARRYYIGIVGKYGAQVQALLKKAAALEIERICPLHGPVLCDNLGYYIGLYDKWSKYEPECDGTVIAYTSVYGNTAAAVSNLHKKLSDLGVKTVSYDLARCDMSRVVSDAFRYSNLVLATTTYNADIFPPMREFINHLTERGFKNRRIALIENGSWAPMAAKVMRSMLDGCKNLEFVDTSVKIFSSLNEESLEQIEKLASELSRG